MSCLIMQPEPLAALANAIEAKLNHDDYEFWGFETPTGLPRAFSDCKIQGTYFAERIYKKLYALNVRAYNDRYKNVETQESETAPDIDVNKYSIHHGPEYTEHGFKVCPWHYQLVKLIDFWLYQTLENPTYNDPVRQTISELRDNLCYFIIRNSPEYGKLPWDQLSTGD